jgi:maleamate amidohydrolase
VSELWADLLGEADGATLRRGRLGRRAGLGERPALLVIDAQNYLVGDRGDDDSWPMDCGAPALAATRRIAELVPAARAAGWPVVFTRFELAADGSDMGVYRRKRDLIDSDHWCLAGSTGAQLTPLVPTAPGDVVLTKTKFSAFTGTPLLGLLVDRHVDSVVVVGGSTSNCVRATAVAAAEHNLRVWVPADCVFDRFELSHRVTLFDLDRQHADVVTAADVLAAATR